MVVAAALRERRIPLTLDKGIANHDPAPCAYAYGSGFVPTRNVWPSGVFEHEPVRGVRPGSATHNMSGVGDHPESFGVIIQRRIP
jgi:hypothetical protein